MKRVLLLVLLGLGCRNSHPLTHPLSDIPGVGAAPQVISRPAAVLFWLPSADTLTADSTAEAVEHLRLLADGLGRMLEGSAIPVLATHASRIYVGGADRPRRAVALAGLNYPWGVILVAPGYPEQIVTGPVDSEDVQDLAWSYFELDDLPLDQRPRRIAGRPPTAGYLRNIRASATAR